MTLKGKVALVTGASRGIGRAIAIGLAQKGAFVVVNFAHNEAEATETARLIRDAGGQEPLVKKFDVSDSAAVDSAVDEIRQSAGGVDILVNNAGISKDGLLLRYKDDDWRKVMGINLDGAFFCSRACSRLMIKKRWGRIINISSVAGEMGNAGQVAYVSAKSGMIGLTKALARELASRQVTVNAITPGFIETDMTSVLSEKLRDQLAAQIPLGFLGAAHDIAHATTFLAGDDARYITGHVLAVNGGMYM
jgi:3-oxoacyl-[acyl-carrier protein] reductase